MYLISFRACLVPRSSLALPCLTRTALWLKCLESCFADNFACRMDFFVRASEPNRLAHSSKVAGCSCLPVLLLNDLTASQWPNEKATGCCTTVARAMTQRAGCSTVLPQIQLPALKLNLLPTEIEIHGAQSGSLMPQTNSSFFSATVMMFLP